MHQHIIETPRLILRPLRETDAEAAFVWLSDPEVNRFMPYTLYTCMEDVIAWLKNASQCTETFNFGFVRKEDGLLIGSGDIGPDEDSPGSWSLGYNLRQDCWGQGYATEAARAMIGFAHDTYHISDFTANHAMANPASGRVMVKCGMSFDHEGEYSRFDGSETFPAHFYRLHLHA